MKLFFTNEDYYYKAMLILNSDCKKSLDRNKAFLLLVNGLSFKNLENLCIEVGSEYNISSNEAYNLIQQGRVNNLLDIAFNIIDKDNFLGNNIINEKINTSSWISHSLYEARLCEILASRLNLDKDIAFNYGLMHDYGRKYSHNFSHVTKGFEELIDLGLRESRACLTHSFINDGRFNNNEIPDVKLDYINNKEHFNSEYDDLSKLLRNITYTDYDRILNIADLMASDHGILSPIDRIYDILSRRGELDKAPNRIYFLTSFYNTLLWYLNSVGVNTEFNYLDFNNLTLDEIYNYLSLISNIFYDEIISKNKRK